MRADGTRRLYAIQPEALLEADAWLERFRGFWEQRLDALGTELARGAMVLRRHYDADVADVWQACTDPERLPRWLTPVSGELRPGGRYRLAGNAGGQVLRCEPPRLLVVSWEAPGDQPVTRVTAELTPAGQAKAAADRTAAFYLPPA